MKESEVLQYINTIILYLHGIAGQLHTPLSQLRLQQYAQIILFNQLNKVWPCFDFNYTQVIINGPTTLQDIVNRALNYDNTSV